MKCGQIVAEMTDILNADGKQPLINRIWRTMNLEYFRLCSELSWEKLRAEPVELEFSEADDTTGLWLPSDLLGIDLVRDETNDITFIERGRAYAVEDESLYRYWTSFPSRADLYSGTDLRLVKGASSFTSATLTTAGTAVNGEYVQFDDDPSFYEISSATTPFTFTPSYQGDSMTNRPFSIRPWGNTRKLNIIDKAEDAITDKDVKVYYWRFPVMLHRDSDEILLPHDQVLMYRTLRGIPEAKNRFAVSQTMLTDSLKVAKSRNTDFSRDPGPYDQQGNKFDFGTQIFGQRAR